VRSWEYEIRSYHSTGTPTGPPKPSTSIETIRRIGHGFRNPDTYRLRLFLRCGVLWHH